MLERGRVPGALLFAGEDGIGKRLFAVELAKALNCRAPVGVEACDACSSCVRLARLPSAADNAGADALKGIFWSEHRDVGLVRAEKRLITVDQARDLEREINFRPHEGARRVFIIEEADRMNAASANALLKTLEEPPPTAHLILLTARSASLLLTIRSRCQTIRFAPLTAGEIERYLIDNRKRAGADARLAAQLANGRLGVALAFDLDLYRTRRAPMLAVLEALAGGTQPDRARLLRAAEELTDAKQKDEFEPRLEVLEALLHDSWLLALGADAGHVANADVREQLAQLSRHLSGARVARWLESVGRLRAQLAVNVNRRVATDALFLSMAE